MPWVTRNVALATTPASIGTTWFHPWRCDNWRQFTPRGLIRVPARESEEDLVEDNLTTQLSEIEKAEFKTLEGIIAQGMESFITVGNALLMIKDRALYREEFGTFLGYCRERWGIGKNYANRLIVSSQAAHNISQAHEVVPNGTACTPGEIQPTSEYQLRPLTRLEPDQQREAWEKAVKTAPAGKVTHRHVMNTVKELIGPAYSSPPKKKDLYAHSDAMKFATMAISQLERIMDDDPRRGEAFKKVMAWINGQLQGG